MSTASVFGRYDCRDLLRNKSIYLLGCSNIRSLYKDLIWLIERGSLISEQSLRVKNEQSFENDVRVSNALLNNGVDYVEDREYRCGSHSLNYSFLTRLNLPKFIEDIENLRESPPDVIAISSCIWDLTRWGKDWPKQYEKNLKKTFLCLKTNLPSTRIVWMTAFPPSFDCRGGVFSNYNVDGPRRDNLPVNIVMANQFAAEIAREFSYDILDYHQVFQYLMHLHTDDGIHWSPKAVRYMTNMLLTHLAMVWEYTLPSLPRACQRSIHEWNRNLESHSMQLNINEN